MITDPIADLLTRIRNGYMARIAEVRIRHSNLKERLVHILHKNKYLASYEVVAVDGSEAKKEIVIKLANVRETHYVPSFRRISKPGQRIYVHAEDIKKSRNGQGIYIVSTSKGIITGYEAHALKIGGELLCEVY